MRRRTPQCGPRHPELDRPRRRVHGGRRRRPPAGGRALPDDPLGCCAAGAPRSSRIWSRSTIRARLRAVRGAAVCAVAGALLRATRPCASRVWCRRPRLRGRQARARCAGARPRDARRPDGAMAAPPAARARGLRELLQRYPASGRDGQVPAGFWRSRRPRNMLVVYAIRGQQCRCAASCGQSMSGRYRFCPWCAAPCARSSSSFPSSPRVRRARAAVRFASRQLDPRRRRRGAHTCASASGTTRAPPSRSSP